MSKLLNKVTPTVESLAKKYNVSVVEVKKQLMRGIKVEKEHTNNPKIAREIALDHLGEKLNYYKLLSKIEEETGVGSVRGLGYVSGDPAVNPVSSYINTNAMAYEDENGNKLGYLKQMHLDLHNKGIGYNFFNPTDIKGSKNFMSEGISAGPEREVPIIGDLTGSSRKVSKVDEVKLPAKVKKSIATGMTIANLYTAGDVASRAQQGVGHPVKDMVTAASTLPGTKGWTAYAADKARQAYDYVKKGKEMKEEKGPCWKGYEMVGMKKKRGRTVPNCVPKEQVSLPRYTERPTLEQNKYPDTAERGIYEFDTSSLPMSKNIEDRRTGPSITGGTTPQNLEGPTSAKSIKASPTVSSTTTPSADTSSGRTFPINRQGKLDRAQMDRNFDSKTPAPASSVYEDWQKVNRRDRTSGLSQKAVDAYRREHPGSKLQTAVTEKNPTGKRAARRKSFCSRMSGMKRRLTSAKTARDPDSNINKALRRWNCEESVINELKAETLGSYIKKASASRKKSLKGASPDVKTWAKRHHGIRTAIKKLTDVDESNHKHIHINKPDTKIEPGAEGLTHTIHEVRKMENKDFINEAIENIVDNNLVDMKENLMTALQEKVMEKLEERKKIIASEYFAQ